MAVPHPIPATIQSHLTDTAEHLMTFFPPSGLSALSRRPEKDQPREGQGKITYSPPMSVFVCYQTSWVHRLLGLPCKRRRHGTNRQKVNPQYVYVCLELEWWRSPGDRRCLRCEWSASVQGSTARWQTDP
ncbi:unnamed protein product, partial [Iphiclides podalirius]